MTSRETHTAGGASPPPDEPETATDARPEQDVTIQDVTIPVVHEVLDVERVRHERGGVRVHVTPHVRDERIAIALADEDVEVRRVAVGRPVDAPPPVRTEGDTVIVPVLEEVLVVSKQLVLREEIHLVKRVTERVEEKVVPLRSEHVEISRIDPSDGREDDGANRR